MLLFVLARCIRSFLKNICLLLRNSAVMHFKSVCWGGFKSPIFKFSFSNVFMVKLFGELVSAFSWEVWSWRSCSSSAPWQVRPNDSYALIQKNAPNGKWKNLNNACESGDGRFVTVSSKTRESRKVVKLVIEQEALQNRHNADPDLNGQWQVGPFLLLSVFSGFYNCSSSSPISHTRRHHPCDLFTN